MQVTQPCGTVPATAIAHGHEAQGRTALTTLNVDVYVAPMRPFVSNTLPQGPGDDAMCSPMSSTLISGAREGILVDTLVTLDQVDTLAEWVKRFDKRITGVYITHGHQDHWIGLARIQEHFPD